MSAFLPPPSASPSIPPPPQLLISFGIKLWNALLGKSPQSPPIPRTVEFPPPPSPPSVPSVFPPNVHSNHRYTAISFFPLQLRQQFRQSMTKYFLLIAVLQLWTLVTPVSPLTTWFPLIVIFTVTATKDAVDDIHRRREDKAFNNKIIKRLKRQINGENEISRDSNDSEEIPPLLSSHSVRSEIPEILEEGEIPSVSFPPSSLFENVRSGDLAVGDVIFLPENSEVPADCLMIFTKNSDGSASLQTANVDGENNLKERRAALFGKSVGLEEFLKGRRAFSVECPPPNAAVNSFDAKGILKGGGESFPLSSENFLIQSTIIKSSEWVIGIILYTGGDTKIARNKAVPSAKVSCIDKKIDRATRMVFTFQMILVFLLGTIGTVMAYQDEGRGSVWYLMDSNHSVLDNAIPFIVLPIRFLLLASMMIPISLKVSVDFARIAFAKFIKKDPQMQCDVLNTAIIEELGRIDVVCTDKTGTLTQNILKFAFLVDSAGNSFDLRTPRGLSQSKTEGDENSSVPLILRAMAMCNEGIIRHSASSPSFISSSPDEISLVDTAALCGISLSTKNSQKISIKTPTLTESFEILSVFPFSPDRRRQSVVLRPLSDEKENSNISAILFSKGADDVMMGRRKNPTGEREREIQRTLEGQSNRFAQMGLRCLVFAVRRLNSSEFAEFQRDRRASEDIVDRERKGREFSDKWERNWEIIGMTAVEDSLADGVKDVVKSLRSARLPLYVLTGDKMMTAIEICHLCGIFRRGESSEKPSEIFRIEGGGTVGELKESLERAVRDAENSAEFAVAIDGAAISTIFDSDDSADLRFLFIRLASPTSASPPPMVFCRVTPLQKSQVVEFLQRFSLCVLAIGDGGNDVSMIQKANVGIGIRGREGQQAARSADFAVSSFSALLPLLFVHGHRSMRRTAFISLYCFYKSILIGLLQLSFAFHSHFSGASLFDSFSLISYNVLYTALLGFLILFDENISRETLLSFPSLFSISRSIIHFSDSTLFKWLLRALFHLTVIFVISFSGGTGRTEIILGTSNDQIVIEMTAFTAVVFIQIATVFMEMTAFSSVHFVVTIGTAVAYLGANSLASLSTLSSLHGIFKLLITDGQFIFKLLLILFLCVSPLVIFNCFSAFFIPLDSSEGNGESQMKSLEKWAVQRERDFLTKNPHGRQRVPSEESVDFISEGHFSRDSVPLDSFRIEGDGDVKNNGNLNLFNDDSELERNQWEPRGSSDKLLEQQHL